MRLIAAVRPTLGGGGRLLLAMLAGTGAATAAVALTAVSAWLISRAALHPPVLHLMVAIVAVRACGLSRGVLRYGERLLGHDAAFRMLAAARVRLFARLERLAPAGLAGHRHADLAQRLTADVDAVLDLITRVVLPGAVAAAVGVASVAVIGALLPAAGVALAIALLVTGVLVPVLQRGATRRGDARLAPLRAELATGVVDLVHGLPDLTAYGAVGGRIDRIARADARLRDATRRAAATAGVGAAVTTLVTGACVLAGLLAGAAAVRAGSLNGELLAVVVLTPLAVFEVAGGLPQAAQQAGAARAALRRIAEIMAAPDPVRGPGPGGPGFGGGAAGCAGRAVPTLRVEGVTARWTPDRVAVSGVDLTLRPGARAALVGPSGCGKSTVAALLVRFLDPVAGRVTMDGVDLRDIPGDQVRQVVGYLSEDAYLFDTTIGENLRLARPGAGEDELHDALGRARLLDWVRGLPRGLDTLVGEHGMRLSGGQRRRLALARALLADFRVLILDEPTEHLDDATAAELTRDLLDAAGDRTVLIITHRHPAARRRGDPDGGPQLVELAASPPVVGPPVVGPQGVSPQGVSPDSRAAPQGDLGTGTPEMRRLTPYGAHRCHDRSDHGVDASIGGPVPGGIGIGRFVVGDLRV
ncbi:thiol reductant ABC exporter subunit CydC, partial [Mangrovihabitans endophyticus]|uniref:thiol reductant ABC exporter subunit CydC n=1 Tax=Mangrovihabitans endophyticus TaxID=1751298 RepID=UPI001E3F266D